MYESGSRTVEIAEQANVSARYINSLLQSNNVTRRPRGSWLRQYTINEHYFKTWSNNMAYLLGFFVADGNMPHDHQLISFSQKKPQILETIKSELRSNHPIVLNNTGVYILKINSKIIKDDLINIHGLTPNKSLDVKFPNVPKDYLSHFIRGYFDGDGNVYARGYVASFVGGSLNFMNPLINVLEDQGLEPRLKCKGNYYRVYISGRKTLKQFYNWIYKDKVLYLNRKFEAFPDKNIDVTTLKNNTLKKTKEAVTHRKKLFLDEFKTSKCIKLSCKKIEIKEPTFKSWLKNDNKFLSLFKSLTEDTQDTSLLEINK